MCAVSIAQGPLGFQPAQALINLGVTKGVTAFQGFLIGIGAGFPLAAYLAIPILKVVEQLFGFTGADGIPDRNIQILFAQHQRQFIPLEIQLRKSDFLLAGKTEFTNGLDLAYAMVRMMNGISLINNDSFVLECCLMEGENINMISMLHDSSQIFNGNFPVKCYKTLHIRG
jgi:hypothetical protein